MPELPPMRRTATMTVPWCLQGTASSRPRAASTPPTVATSETPVASAARRASERQSIQLPS